MPNFSIIANNCFSNKLYEGLNLPYTTPLISIFFEPTSFLKLLTNLRWYLHQPLEFVKESRHEVINALRANRQAHYPIAVLGGDVELQCLHYESPGEVREKWARRLARLVPDDSRLFIKFSDEHGCTQSQLEAFDAMPYQHKVCFTSKPMPHLKSAVYIPSQGDCVSFPDQTDAKWFDGAAWVKS